MARFVCAQGVMRERRIERADVTLHRRIALGADEN